MRIPELIDAFGEGRADPDLETERFFQQACWLGWCAELVYPCGSEETEQRDEKEARNAYRAKRRWWRCLSDDNQEESRLKQTWRDAANALDTKVEQRIREEVKNFDDLAFINSFGTQCFVARKDKHIFVCFRGTELSDFRDIFSDLLSFQTKSDHFSGAVHLGFDQALGNVWDERKGGTDRRGTLKQLLDKNEPKTMRSENDTVWITGHSLGGALATLAADRLLNERVLKSDNIGGVFTFGQPRVGDGAFTENYQLPDRHFRFINNNDIVPRVPPPNLMTIVSLFRALFGFGSDKRSNTEQRPPANDDAEQQANESGALGQPTNESGAVEQQPRTSGEPSKDWNLLYRDVGNVVHANRSDQFKRLSKGKFWSKVQLFGRRCASRVRAPFISGRSFTARIFPGIADHLMGQYNHVLRHMANVPDAEVEESSSESPPGEPSAANVDPTAGIPAAH